MSRPMVNDFNCITNEYTYREMTDEEYAQFLIDQEAAQARIVEENNGN